VQQVLNECVVGMMGGWNLWCALWADGMCGVHNGLMESVVCMMG
jgi:hypothetical protein